MSFEYDDINKVLYLIQKGEVHFDVCNVVGNTSQSRNDHLDSVTYYKAKDSVSESEILFAKIILPNLKISSHVALKMWLGWDEITTTQISKYKLRYRHLIPKTVQDIIKINLDNPFKYSSLTYEKKVYEYITKNIILKGFSNNFVPLLFFGTCLLKDIANTLKNTKHFIKDGKALLNKLTDYVSFPNLKLHIMVTGSIDLSHFKNLNDLLESTKLPDSEISSILLQLLYALYVMEKFKIIHNDLHLKNILVEILDTPISINILHTTFMTKYIPKIFDWDHAYVEVLGNNPFLEDDEFINSFHSINKFRKSVDYYQLICGLFKFAQFKPILMQIVPDKSFPSWSAVNRNTDYVKSLKLSREQVNIIHKYIIENPKEIFKVSKITFIQMPKITFDMIIPPIKYKTLLSTGERHRLDHSSQVYFGFENNNEVVFYPGWNCYPIYNPSDKILIPLETIFKTKFYYDILCRSLKVVKL